MAIEQALVGLDVEYSLRSFLRDLGWIREQTFKKSTIRHAFRKSGMYPPDFKQCLKQLKTFNPPKVAKDDQSLPTLPQTPTKPMECEAQLSA